MRALTLAKVQDAEREELRSRHADHEDVARLGFRLQWLQALRTNVQNAIAASSGALVLVVGGSEVADGSITIGGVDVTQLSN